LAQELPGAIWANQFDNTANRMAHFESTGPEIWRDADADRCLLRFHRYRWNAGRSCRFLKSKSASIRIVLVDPPGSALYHYFKDGELKSDGGSSITEGIGTGRITANLEGAPIDDALRIPDTETMHYVYRLLPRRGIAPRQHAGINVAAASSWQSNGPGHTIVTVLCDGGAKYQSRLFNKAWIQEKGFAEAVA